MSLARQGVIEHWLWRMAPLLNGFAAALLDLLPLPDAAPVSLAPFLTVGVAYFWTVYRPDLLTPLALFAIGVTLDAVGGLPLGLTALSLLIVRGLLMPRQRFLLRQPFAVVWACFLLVVVAVAGLRWLLASLFWGHPFPIEPMLFEAGLTFAVYPLIGWLLARLQRQVVAHPHAAGG